MSTILTNYLKFHKSNKFSQYLHAEQNEHSISSNFITSLFEDKNKNIWVGTDGGGLNKLEVSNGNFTRFKHLIGDKTSLANNIIRAIIADDSGQIWIATFNGLEKYLPEIAKTHL